MVDRLVVACVQQKMHLPLTLDEYREDLRRFLRVAGGKQARLVVFPELAGVMAAPPVLRDTRSQLLKLADRGERRRASLWQRGIGGLAGLLATALHADLRAGLAGLLDVSGQDVWQIYQELFGGLAREFETTLVAPSTYLPDPVDGVIRNMTCVYDSSGVMVGRQAKVVLGDDDADLAQPGSTWDVIPTEAGRLGVILGADVLYPEVGRVLAYQGAEALVVQAASTDLLAYNKVRAAALARMQDNQVFAALSFVVGPNRLTRARRAPFVGKSALFAPQELTPRENGVLVEMGTARSEGVLAAPWDYAALRSLWETSSTPVRRRLPVQQAGQMLATLYARLQGLPAPDDGAGAQVDAPGPAGSESVLPLAALVALRLADLEVIGSVTYPWPLPADPELLQPDEDDAPPARSDVTSPGEGITQTPATGLSAQTDGGREAEEVEDETDEMDAVPGRQREG